MYQALDIPNHLCRRVDKVLENETSNVALTAGSAKRFFVVAESSIRHFRSSASNVLGFTYPYSRYPSTTIDECRLSRRSTTHASANAGSTKPSIRFPDDEPQFTNQSCSIETFISQANKLSLLVTSDQNNTWDKLFGYFDLHSASLRSCILLLASASTRGQYTPSMQSFQFRCEGLCRKRKTPQYISDVAFRSPLNKNSLTNLAYAAQIASCFEEDKAVDQYLICASTLEQSNDIRNALALIYRNLHFRARDSEFTKLNSEIAAFDPEQAGIDVLLAILTATKPIKHLLRSRSRLFRQTKSVLKKRGDWAPGLLDGLK